MSLLQWANYRGLPDYTVDEVRPYALPIIVRLEKNAEMVPSREEAMLATAKAMIEFFESDKTCAGGAWKPNVDAWLEGRIRKIARRARAGEWETVRNMDGIYASYGKAEVMILPPHPVDDVPKEIKKLQVAGLDLVRDSNFIVGDTCGHLQFAVNPQIEMSTGKTLAQVGHAVQLTIFGSDRKTLNSWRENNHPISITNWEVLEGNSFTVHDAGFTEVAAGSLTAKGALHY